MSPEPHAFLPYTDCKLIDSVNKIYQAKDPQTERTVAIQAFALETNSMLMVFGRFEQEIRQIKQLSSSYLPRILHVETDTHTPWYAMEWIGAPALSGMIDTPPSAATALSLAWQTLGGLKLLHAHGITHGNLRPDSLLYSKTGCVHLIDFHLGIHSNCDTDHDQQSSAQYWSPARAASGQTSPQDDLHALGVILGKWMGAPQLAEKGEADTTTGTPASTPRKSAPEYPDAFIAWIGRLTGQGQDTPFQSAVEARDALDALPIHLPATSHSGAHLRTGSTQILTAPPPAPTAPKAARWSLFQKAFLIIFGISILATVLGAWVHLHMQATRALEEVRKNLIGISTFGSSSIDGDMLKNAAAKDGQTTDDFKQLTKELHALGKVPVYELHTLALLTPVEGTTQYRYTVIDPAMPAAEKNQVTLNMKITATPLLTRAFEGLRPTVLQDLSLDINSPAGLHAATPILDSTQHPVGLLVISLQESQLHRVRSQLLRSILVAGIMWAFFSFIASAIIAYIVVRPIRGILNAINAVNQQDYSQMLSVNTEDELGVLSQAINNMTGLLRRKDVLSSAMERYQQQELARRIAARMTPSVQTETALLMINLCDWVAVAAQPEAPASILSRMQADLVEIFHTISCFGGEAQRFHQDEVILVLFAASANADAPAESAFHAGLHCQEIVKRWAQTSSCRVPHVPMLILHSALEGQDDIRHQIRERAHRFARATVPMAPLIVDREIRQRLSWSASMMPTESKHGAETLYSLQPVKQ